MIKDSKCIYLIKGKMKGFQGVHLNITLSLIMTVMFPKRWRVYALCFCSLWGFCSVAGIFGPFSKLFCSCTSNHHRQMGIPAACWPFPLMAGLSCLQRHQHTLATHHLELSKDKLFSPARMSESQPRSLEGPQSLLLHALPLCRPSGTNPHTSPLSPLFLPFPLSRIGTNCFSFYPPRFSPRDPVDLDWQQINKGKAKSLVMCPVHITWVKPQ